VIEGRELQETRAATERGAGTCVGRAVPPNLVRIIRIGDDAIANWSDELLLSQSEVGEITVAGPTATDSYFNRPAATKLAKIVEGLADGTDRSVHRMGDVGYFDPEGRLWFCGRKSHRVETVDGPLYTEQVEPVFNTHPEVHRTALVGLRCETCTACRAPSRRRVCDAQTPVLCVEAVAGAATSQHARILEELREIGARHPHTARVERFAFHPKFPVDIRHNAKIGREKLAIWAARRSRLPK
jgi:acyl-CoA synthetase (AMP-forming)/AMP-acid ligase II